jgi:arylsulfatase A-like enzyme
MRKPMAAVVLLLLTQFAFAAQQSRYDVLFIAVDDLNDWVGYLGGHPQTQTPNIDRLAAEGVAFMNAQSPSAVCHAVRTALLTGMRPSTTGIYGNGPDWRTQEIFQGKQTLPRLFRDNGYLTEGAGKIFHAHSYNPAGLVGFNDTTAWDAFYPGLDRQLPDELSPMIIPANGAKWGRTFDWAGLVAEDFATADGQDMSWVVRRIGEHSSQPRFIAAGIYRPHLPWYVPQRYFDKFPVDAIQLPPHIDGDLDDVPDIARRSTFNSVEIHKWILDQDQWKKGVQAYLASVSFADAMVGEVLDALQASGRAKNTIIVLWADHGFHLGTKERWRKFTLWKESLHVPFIVVVPGMTRPGTRIEAPVSTMDIYRTLAELAGLQAPSYVEGRSLVPLLKNPKMAWDHPTLSTFGYNNHAVVSDKYKYIRYSDGSEELYDVRQDPHEWTNLAGKPGLQAIKQDLARYMPAENAPDLARGIRGPKPPLDE